MPKISVRIPHSYSAAEALEKVAPALEKTAKDFQGHDLKMDVTGTSATYSFRSMAFTIKGKVEASNSDVLVEVELPFAAMMFKDQAERATAKNMKRALQPPDGDAARPEPPKP